MDDIYTDEPDPDNTPNENTSGISTTDTNNNQYKRIIGKLFRSYFIFNFALILSTAALTFDIFTNGGSIIGLTQPTTTIAAILPTAITTQTTQLLGDLTNTLFIGSTLLVLYGAHQLYTTTKQANQIDMDNLTLNTTDTTEQERLIRQRGYVNYGKTLTPIALTIGTAIALLFTLILKYAVPAL